MRLRASFTVAFRGDQCGDSSIPSDRRQLLEFLNQLAYGERAGGGKNTWSRGADELDKKRLEWRKHWLPSPAAWHWHPQRMPPESLWNLRTSASWRVLPWHWHGTGDSVQSGRAHERTCWL